MAALLAADQHGHLAGNDLVWAAEGFEDGVAYAAGGHVVDEDGGAAVDDDSGSVGWDWCGDGADVDVAGAGKTAHHAAHAGEQGGFGGLLGCVGGWCAGGSCGGLRSGYRCFHCDICRSLDCLNCGGCGQGNAAPGGEVADEHIHAAGPRGEWGAVRGGVCGTGGGGHGVWGMM